MKCIKVLLVLITMQMKLLGQSPEPCLGCWESIWLPQMTITCGTEDTIVNEDFAPMNPNLWQTEWGGEWSRVHIPLNENLYLDEQVIQHSDHVELRGEKKDVSWPKPAGLCSPSETLYRKFAGGLLHGKGEVNKMNYGTMETTLKLPTEEGWWPSFWMWNWDEIDVVELFEWEDRFKSNVYVNNPRVYCDTPSTSHEYEHGWASTWEDKITTLKFEWTPFVLRSFVDGDLIEETEVWRFYDLNGQPLKLGCGDTIPEGEYKINPAFIQTKSRFFQPIFTLAVLPENEPIDVDGIHCPLNRYDERDPNKLCSTPGCDMYIHGGGYSGRHYQSEEGYTYDNPVSMRIYDYKLLKKDWIIDEGMMTRYKKREYVGVCASWEVENIGSIRQSHKVKVNSISHSGNLTIHTTFSPGDLIHTIDFTPDTVLLNSYIEVDYENDNGVTKKERITFDVLEIGDDATIEFDPDCMNCFTMSFSNLCGFGAFNSTSLTNVDLNGVTITDIEKVDDFNYQFCAPCLGDMSVNNNLTFDFNFTTNCKAFSENNGGGPGDDFVQYSKSVNVEFQMPQNYIQQHLNNYNFEKVGFCSECIVLEARCKEGGPYIYNIETIQINNQSVSPNSQTITNNQTMFCFEEEDYINGINNVTFTYSVIDNCTGDPLTYQGSKSYNFICLTQSSNLLSTDPYPNPFNNQLSLDFDNNSLVQNGVGSSIDCHVQSMSGLILHQETLDLTSTLNHSLDLSQISYQGTLKIVFPNFNDQYVVIKN